MKRIFILASAIALLFSSMISFAQEKKEPAPLYPKTDEVKAKPQPEKAKPATAAEKPKTEKKLAKAMQNATEKVKAGFGVSVVQEQAEFPGGQEALSAFVSKNTTYPKTERVSGVEGRVYVGFTISNEGKIKNIRVLSSLNDELDAEAMRVVSIMPDWKPATKSGVAVDDEYILPFDFILPKKL